MNHTNLPQILILTWRDSINNKEAGGSEVYIDNIVNGLKNNYNITIFSSKSPKQKSDETYNGVRYIRRGSRYTVYFWAALYYLFNLRHTTDFIIDVENGVPFFSPLYSRKPKVALVHHFHNGQWFKEFPFPVAIVGYCVERFLMPAVYKTTKFITVSNSSRLDLECIGVPSNNIDVAYNGVNISYRHSGLSRIRPHSSLREVENYTTNLYKKPTVLYLGRLKKYKRIDLAIKAVGEIKKTIPDVQLTIAGTGDDAKRLKQIVKEEKLQKNVRFLGFVDERRKSELLARSWVFVNPSSKEGWGVVNVEANYFGTPVVGFNVYGVRDSVSNGVSGLLAETYSDFVYKLGVLLNDKLVLSRLSGGAKEWAGNFNWEDTVNTFNTEIKNQLGLVDEIETVKVKENVLSVQR